MRFADEKIQAQMRFLGLGITVDAGNSERSPRPKYSRA
jgi:hypothetical protein